MVNNTVNGKKIGKSAGKDDNTIVVGLEVLQKIRDDVVQTGELEAKGKLLREVNPKEYIRIKAYANKDLNKPKQPIKSQSTKQKEMGE